MTENLRTRAVVVGESIIYLISSVLEPPASVVTTAISDLRLSTFVASIYAASLDKTLSRTPGTTILAPENPSFAALGLVMSYLLLPAARSELRSVLRYHVIDEVLYLDDFPAGGARRYPTLNGAEIFVERQTGGNATLAVHGPTVGGRPANGETRDARVFEGDVLTETGVLHIIDQVELPPDLNIGIAKILKGGKLSTFADLVRAANMSWVLDGKAPPTNEDEDAGLDTSGLGNGGGGRKNKDRLKRKAKPDRAYTLLCPTDKALARLNLTALLADPPALSALVKLHIIPTSAFAPLATDGRPLALADERVYPTLLDVHEGGDSQYGSVAFRRWGDDEWMVGVKGARGASGATDAARVVAFGRASPWYLPDEEGGDDDGRETLRRLRASGSRLAGGGGVLAIDAVLLPYEPGWWRRWGWIVLLVVLGGAVLACVTLLALKLWRGREKPYEPLEGEE